MSMPVDLTALEGVQISGRTIYKLDERGVNIWSANFQPNSGYSEVLADKAAQAVFGATSAYAAAAVRCGHCDGTGDVHSIDGEWRGRCSCPAGSVPLKAARSEDSPSTVGKLRRAVARAIDPGAFGEENDSYWIGAVRSEARVNSALSQADAAIRAYEAARTAIEADDQERAEAWSGFESEFLTDGVGHSPMSTYGACRSAFDRAWVDGEQAAMAAASEEFRRIQSSTGSHRNRSARTPTSDVTVWFGAMPETNGKSNWTAMLVRRDGAVLETLMTGLTLERSEFKDRVRYAADRARYLLGELTEEPDIMDYDPELTEAVICSASRDDQKDLNDDG